MSPKRTIILLISANPKDTERLRIDEEVRAIETAIEQARFRDQFELEYHVAVRVGDLQRLMLKHRPQIVHFAGHGAESNGIMLEDISGNAVIVPPAAFSRVFACFRPMVQCVVLNACFTEEQAAGIVSNVDYVVGMSTAIGDKAAIAFAGAFYQALAYGENLQNSFDQACLQIDLLALEEGQTPQLLAKGGAAAKMIFAHIHDSEEETTSGHARATPPSGSQFETNVTGGEVGYVINVDKLDGGLTFGKG